MKKQKDLIARLSEAVNVEQPSASKTELTFELDDMQGKFSIVAKPQIYTELDEIKANIVVSLVLEGYEVIRYTIRPEEHGSNSSAVDQSLAINIWNCLNDKVDHDKRQNKRKEVLAKLNVDWSLF